MKLGNIEIKVQQFADGRWGFDQYLMGQRNRIRCRSKAQADARATEFALKLANGRTDLLSIDQTKLQQFLKWEAAQKNSPSISDALPEFLKLKQNKSSHHARSLERDLNLLAQFVGPTKTMATITALDIQRFLDSRTSSGDRRKFNLRAQTVMLFRWARRMSYLPDATTEAEKVEQIEKRPGQPNVLTPEQMRILLDNVNPDYLPWLVIGAFAGIRSQEIAPERGSQKSPLAWEDFDWKHGVIIVRAATAKTKEDREVPILPNLAAWLAPYMEATGPVLGNVPRQPSDKETVRLGALIGGWKHNCLRDSFCSYRARIIQNVPQVSYEMGNSIAMVKRSYHRRQPIEAAEAWFNIEPVKDQNVIAFSHHG